MTIANVGTWSYHQNANRGHQQFTLFGSSSHADPGWNVGKVDKLVPIATVRSTCTGKFLATRISGTQHDLATYRWLIWAVSPVTAQDENTAFQEFQVIPRDE